MKIHLIAAEILVSAVFLTGSSVFASGHGASGAAPPVGAAHGGGPAVHASGAVPGYRSMGGYRPMGVHGGRYVGRNGAVYGMRPSVYAGQRVYRPGGTRYYGNPYYSSAVRNSTVHHPGSYQSSASGVNRAANVNPPRSVHPATGAHLNRNERLASSASNTHSPSEGPSSVQSATQKQGGASDTLAMRHHGRNGGDSQLQDPRHQQDRLDAQTSARLRNFQGRKPGFAEARRFTNPHDGDHHHNGDHHHDGHHHHDHDWWHHHCPIIIWADWGWWGWYDGWWYPAWGYDASSYYATDDPIYAYDGLSPDQIIANVQGALQEEGYFNNAADGVMGPVTRAALANFQRDHGLAITSAIDQPTLRALGFGG